MSLSSLCVLIAGGGDSEFVALASIDILLDLTRVTERKEQEIGTNH
jgi:hypothetical protein